MGQRRVYCVMVLLLVIVQHWEAPIWNIECISCNDVYNQSCKSSNPVESKTLNMKRQREMQRLRERGRELKFTIANDMQWRWRYGYGPRWSLVFLRWWKLQSWLLQSKPMLFSAKSSPTNHIIWFFCFLNLRL